MALSSSLNAGVQGLAVNAVRIATISDNIANSGTFGYKRVETDFTSVVLSQSRGSFSAGGVRAATFRDVAQQGAVISTTNSTDIAIGGRGFLPVTDLGGLTAPSGDRRLLLTTTGSFSPDQDGFLRTSSGLFLLGWPADANGTVVVPSRDSSVGLEPVQTTLNQFAAAPTTRIELGVNLPASETSAGASGGSFSLPTEYFDNVGRSQTLDLTFSPTVPATGSSNQWLVEIRDSANPVPGTVISAFTVTFNDTPGLGGTINSVTAGAGATYDPATGAVSLTTEAGPLDLFIGRPNTLGALSQLSSNFSPTGVVNDGAPIGSLAGVEISPDGRLDAIFNNGFRRTIYQIPVADVPNVNGLNAEESQTYSLSQTSGNIFFFDAGSGPVGVTSGFSLSESTTDIAGELTDLIETQRAYSSNARVISAVDDLLEETTNITR
jgi:flagellar hook protein FlgE